MLLTENTMTIAEALNDLFSVRTKEDSIKTDALGYLRARHMSAKDKAFVFGELVDFVGQESSPHVRDAAWDLMSELAKGPSFPVNRLPPGTLEKMAGYARGEMKLWLEGAPDEEGALLSLRALGALASQPTFSRNPAFWDGLVPMISHGSAWLCRLARQTLESFAASEGTLADKLSPEKAVTFLRGLVQTAQTQKGEEAGALLLNILKHEDTATTSALVPTLTSAVIESGRGTQDLQAHGRLMAALVCLGEKGETAPSFFDENGPRNHVLIAQTLLVAAHQNQLDEAVGAMASLNLYYKESPYFTDHDARVMKNVAENEALAPTIRALALETLAVRALAPEREAPVSCAPVDAGSVYMTPCYVGGTSGFMPSLFLTGGSLQDLSISKPPSRQPSPADLLETTIDLVARNPDLKPIFFSVVARMSPREFDQGARGAGALSAFLIREAISQNGTADGQKLACRLIPSLVDGVHGREARHFLAVDSCAGLFFLGQKGATPDVRRDALAAVKEIVQEQKLYKLAKPSVSCLPPWSTMTSLLNRMTDFVTGRGAPETTGDAALRPMVFDMLELVVMRRPALFSEPARANLSEAAAQDPQNGDFAVLAEKLQAPSWTRFLPNFLTASR